MYKDDIKKYSLISSFVIISIYAGLPRILSVSSGLPYHHFWDEPVIATGALVDLKTNRFFPKGHDLVYGGGLRYPVMFVDFLYYQYLKLSPSYDVSNKSDIKTYREGVYKTTSHSGFYYWSRVFVVVICVLGFIFAFEIGRLRGGYTMGFVVVILLASVASYYNTSFRVNVDIPLSTWVLGAILFSLKFNRDKNIRYFYYSLICVGVAAGTKYTGALTFVIPLSAAILNRDIFNWSKRLDVVKSLLRWSGISFAVFAILNPVVVVFPDRMYKIIVWIGEVYRSQAIHFSKEPGLEHLKYQIGELIHNYGTLFFSIALVSLIIGIIRLTRKNFWANGTNSGFIIIVVFPSIYLLYVTFIYAIAYHRNFYLMYPILAILSAEACSAIIYFFTRLSSKLAKIKIGVGFLMMVLIFYLSYSGYSSILYSGININKSIETRTAGILEINKFADENPNIFLGIDDNLLISPEDLRKLKVSYGFFDISDIDNAVHGFTHLLFPDYNSNLEVQNFESLKLRVQSHISESTIKVIQGHKLVVQATLSDHEFPIYNPAIIITKGEDYPPSKMVDYILPKERIEALTIGDHKPVEIFSTRLNKGKYLLLFESKGDLALGEYPIIKILMEKDTLATINTGETFTKNKVEFNVSSTGKVKIFIWMINDYYDPEKSLDRNTHLRRIELWEVEDNNN